MLRKLSEETASERIPIQSCAFPEPFSQGLEYSSPARGCWNIVHTGMLIPESHQIFVCAKGCLRGVVLTAAEMNAMDRYSSILIEEDTVLDGSMEELMIEGVTDVLSKLKTHPKAVLLFISCQHFFLAYDQQYVFLTLRERFPDIRFVDCYMIPTLRKSGITPDQKMRIQMYQMLEPKEKNSKKIQLIGSNLPISKSCELYTELKKAGYEFLELSTCKTFEDYLDLATASLNLYYEPIAQKAAQELQQRLGQESCYLPFVYQFDRIEAGYQKLTERLHLPPFDMAQKKQRAIKSIQEAREQLKDTPIVLDYTFTFRILSFTRLLIEQGFCVKTLYLDHFLAEEKEDYEWIVAHQPDLIIMPTMQPDMRFAAKKEEGKIVAIGQKAAYFTQTDYFVNVAESGGLFGFDGIRQIFELLLDAYLHKKDARQIIQKKGYGCKSCL